MLIEQRIFFFATELLHSLNKGCNVFDTVEKFLCKDSLQNSDYCFDQFSLVQFEGDDQ